MHIEGTVDLKNNKTYTNPNNDSLKKYFDVKKIPLTPYMLPLLFGK